MAPNQPDDFPAFLPPVLFWLGDLTGIGDVGSLDSSWVCSYISAKTYDYISPKSISESLSSLRMFNGSTELDLCRLSDFDLECFTVLICGSSSPTSGMVSNLVKLGYSVSSQLSSF